MTTYPVLPIDPVARNAALEKLTAQRSADPVNFLEPSASASSNEQFLQNLLNAQKTQNSQLINSLAAVQDILLRDYVATKIDLKKTTLDRDDYKDKFHAKEKECADNAKIAGIRDRAISEMTFGDRSLGVFSPVHYDTVRNRAVDKHTKLEGKKS